ncbi:MAG TPA: hypothetical protein VIA62_09940 [Thermoanaerobaculia bacterium]|jgi:hypothetical protein|nr:hypothetical protein [Thermoanaerobaculia bacterium]
MKKESQKPRARKLQLIQETLRQLDEDRLKVAGGTIPPTDCSLSAICGVTKGGGC